MIKAIALFLLISANVAHAQEWKSLRAYRKATGNASLAEGSWLKKHRKKKTETWKQANKYNLSLVDGHTRYKTIRQMRDFYLWFDEERKRQGHEIQYFGITAIVENEFAKLDSWFICTFIISNKEVINFAHEGSLKVFEYSFPKMRSILFSDAPLTGKAAEQWDMEHGTGEQCKILQPLYNKLSPRAFKTLERIAKRKVFYWLGIPKALEYEGNLADCNSRVDYAIKKILPYYLQKEKKLKP
jgi:hypothetical protein